MSESQTISVQKILRQKIGIEEFFSVSGTPSGTALGIAAVETLQSSDGDILFDFEGIFSMSGSAACAFWLYLCTHLGFDTIERVGFVNLEPSAMEALKYGLESTKERLNSSHKAVG